MLGFFLSEGNFSFFDIRKESVLDGQFEKVAFVSFFVELFIFVIELLYDSFACTKNIFL